ncbi:aldo/keto reductase [Streptomyces sp. NPDC058861]|uniref:aldo/keto reductase n=1 Tax=Streptomyces sp. NPDC058861 TaxID=3346653 RepID=UPI003698B4C8
MTASHLPPRRLITGRDEHPLGVGCRPIGGPAINEGHPVGWAPVGDGNALDTLLRAHSLGATVYDTSDIYGLGHSQRLLGKMLAQVPRSSVRVICTIGKYRGTGEHAYSSLNLFRQVEQSLENLGAGHLDVLVLAHTDFGPDDRYLEEARETLQALRDAGDVTAIGMRVPSFPSANPAVGGRNGRSRYDFLFQQLSPQVLSTTLHPLVPQNGPATTAGLEAGDDAFSLARRHKAATIVHAPLLHGLLTGKYGPDTVFSPGDLRSRYTAPMIETIHRHLGALRDHFGTDPQALARTALQYCLKRCPDSIVLTGISSPEQANANFEEFSSAMSDADYAVVERVYAALHAELRPARPACSA